MGAELYIEPVCSKVKAECQPLLEAAVAKLAEAGTETEKAVYQQEVDHYSALMESLGRFQDPYNPSSTLWKVGLSWWRDVRPRLKPTEKGPALYPEDVRWLKDQVASAELKPPFKLESVTKGDQMEGKMYWSLLSLFGAEAFEFPQRSEAEWEQYFHTRRDYLVRFLDLALQLNEPISCSL